MWHVCPRQSLFGMGRAQICFIEEQARLNMGREGGHGQFSGSAPSCECSWCNINVVHPKTRTSLSNGDHRTTPAEARKRTTQHSFTAVRVRDAGCYGNLGLVSQPPTERVSRCPSWVHAACVVHCVNGQSVICVTQTRDASDVKRTKSDGRGASRRTFLHTSIGVVSTL